MLTGENGILTQAQRAKTETEQAQADEENTLTNYEQYINASKDGNTLYTDDTGKIAVIPKGFYIVPGLDIIDNGLVISDVENDTQNTGNQFVWIPVETPVADAEENGTETKAMAIKDKETNNYRGLLYDFTTSGSTVKSGCTTTTTSFREPDIVTTGTDYDAQYYESAEYGSLDEMKQDLQSQYNKMMESVEKYYGFYVGRYELGLDANSNPTSKKAENGVITADNSNPKTSMWYGLYSKCKEFAMEEGNKSVVSSMIWGSQYDAIMNWMQKDGLKVNQPTDGINTVNNSNTTTGSEPKDILKNIFDIYGCHYEWTLEAYSNELRVSRGGYYGGSTTPGYRNARQSKLYRA